MINTNYLFPVLLRLYYLNGNTGGFMHISTDDMNELKRLATNTYEQEKSSQVYRIIRAITDMENRIKFLKTENQKLKDIIAASENTSAK